MINCTRKRKVQSIMTNLIFSLQYHSHTCWHCQNVNISFSFRIGYFISAGQLSDCCLAIFPEASFKTFLIIQWCLECWQSLKYDLSSLFTTICNIHLALWMYVISEWWFQYVYFPVFKKQKNLAVREWCAVPQKWPNCDCTTWTKLQRPEKNPISTWNKWSCVESNASFHFRHLNPHWLGDCSEFAKPRIWL